MAARCRSGRVVVRVGARDLLVVKMTSSRVVFTKLVSVSIVLLFVM